jgi:hypothetical protein
MESLKLSTAIRTLVGAIAVKLAVPLSGSLPWTDGVNYLGRLQRLAEQSQRASPKNSAQSGNIRVAFPFPSR